MSSYENYSQTAGSYDLTRVPIGTEVILGCLCRSPTPLAQQHVLDAGCGTGNYSRALLGHVRHITAVDLNPAMLEQARSKFTAGEQKRIEFHQSSIERLPFDSATFDALMINQVMHHIDDRAEDGYPRVGGILQEFARVLKPGGVVVINTCSHQQLRHGFWYYSLIPEEMARMCDRHVSLPRLEGILQAAGFESTGRIVPLDAVIQGRAYFDARGPLEQSWRDGDSIWATVPEERIDSICDRLEELDDKGELEAFMRQQDAARDDIGQFTFVYAKRK